MTFQHGSTRPQDVERPDRYARVDEDHVSGRVFDGVATGLARDFLLDGSPAAPVYRVLIEGASAASVRLIRSADSSADSALQLRAACAPAAASGQDVLSQAPIAASVAIGVFDGLHLGHRGLLSKTVADARARGVAAIAITFDPDPDVVLSAHPASKLMTVADRLSALARAGIDAVVVVPFTKELAALDHVAFFDRVLAPVIDIESVHVGSDFRLGAKGASTVPVMRAWFARRGVEVYGHDLVRSEGSVVSATRVRGLIAAGELDQVREELGRNYYVRGEVVHGRGQGTGMGFPTANVRRSEHIQMPVDGVYAGWALLPNGEAWPAAINVGLPPMFADNPESATLEATLLGFSGDIYGQDIAVLFSKLLRRPISFGSLGELIATVKRDMATTADLFGDKPVDLSAAGVALGAPRSESPQSGVASQAAETAPYEAAIQPAHSTFPSDPSSKDRA